MVKSNEQSLVTTKKCRLIIVNTIEKFKPRKTKVSIIHHSGTIPLNEIILFRAHKELKYLFIVGIVPLAINFETSPSGLGSISTYGLSERN